jgi:hypothetical protein
LTQTRAAIIGTAQSWALTPWADPSMYLCSLNDAYRLNGFVRADAWYDLHPLDKFFSPVEGQPIYQHQVPPGHYARPSEHKAWLAQQMIPVWLHPDHATQDPASLTWKSARAFPRAEIEAYFGRYFTSSPAWMLAHLMLQGFKEIHVYGIHLATEAEYREQRPQMEFLAGRFLGRGKLAMTVKDGLRHYETADAHLVFPEASPVLQQDWQYAFEPKPGNQHKEQLKWDAHRYGIKRERAVAALKAAPWWQSKKQLQNDLWRYEAYQADVQDALQRVDLAQHWR